MDMTRREFGTAIAAAAVSGVAGAPLGAQADVPVEEARAIYKRSIVAGRAKRA